MSYKIIPQLLKPKLSKTLTFCDELEDRLDAVLEVFCRFCRLVSLCELDDWLFFKFSSIDAISVDKFDGVEGFIVCGSSDICKEQIKEFNSNTQSNFKLYELY